MKILLSVILIFFSYSIVTVTICQQISDTANNANSSIDKYKITMELEKKIYKKYEPVIAKFTFINYSDSAIEIYDLFNAEEHGSHITIIYENGNKYSKNQNSFYSESFLVTPSYVVNPGETLYVSMPLNNWGVKAELNLSRGINEIYFGQWGYFNPGKYKAYYYLTTEQKEYYNNSWKTNDVEFEVTKNTIEDKELLTLYKAARDGKIENYDEILLDYPDNPLVEHVFANYLTSIHYKVFGKLDYSLKGKLEQITSVIAIRQI